MGLGNLWATKQNHPAPDLLVRYYNSTVRRCDEIKCVTKTNQLPLPKARYTIGETGVSRDKFQFFDHKSETT